MVARNPDCHAFNTFFYPKIKKEGHDSVKRWTKKVDLFSKRLVIIPVHLTMHWCMCIVDIEKLRIEYYDSLSGRESFYSPVLAYLKNEWAAKRKGQPFPHFTEERIKVPQYRFHFHPFTLIRIARNKTMVMTAACFLAKSQNFALAV
jgi:Ulp1 family protease